MTWTYDIVFPVEWKAHLVAAPATEVDEVVVEELGDEILVFGPESIGNGCAVDLSMSS